MPGAVDPAAAGLEGGADEGDEEGGGLALPPPEEEPEAAEAPKPAAASETIDPNRGVVVSDEMVFQNVDIRERRIELRVEASRASAQDRFIRKLREIGCLANIEKGKIKGEERKSFDLSMDNNCYTSTSTVAEPTAEDESEGA